MGMKKQKHKEEKRKEIEEVEEDDEVAEDWCFECYEGGLLLVCDHKLCLKSYHEDCVREDKSVLGNDDPWFCRRHSCQQCKKNSKYLCFGCPSALCKHCINGFKFAVIRGNKGLCHNCAKLALLGEEGMDVDSDGERVDFEDLETNEGLFFDYWKKVVKVKEGLTLEHLQAAHIQINKSEKYKVGYKLKDSDNEEEFQPISISDDDDHKVDDVEVLRTKLVHKRKRSNEQKLAMHRGLKFKNVIPKSKGEIVSWASNCLLDFLSSVGEDTSKKYETYQIASIIHRYAEDNKLIHPEKPRKIMCDVKLKCLLGKKIVEKNKVVDLLEPHFPEYLESSEEEEVEEIRYSSEHLKKRFIAPSRNQKKSITPKINDKTEEMVSTPQSRFAFIVSENIKLVYLKKSLVLGLLREPETFESKIIGSFVRVKSDLGAGSRRHSFQLLPVTGINKTSNEENHSQIHLQVSTLTKDISTDLLSDDNFSEEECEDLRKKVKDGLIRKATIEELEQKARTLHEDITKHGLVKELATLQNRIDRANEKGWRREFFECSERQRLLRTPEEQSRLLQKVPFVIPDMAEDESIDNIDIEEDVKAKSVLSETLEIPGSNGEETITSSEDKEETKHVHTVKLAEEKKIPENQINDKLQADKKHGGIASCHEENCNPSMETYLLDAMSQQSHHVAPQVEDNVLFECEFFQNFQK